MNKIIKESFKDSLPIMAGYLVLGSGFGIMCTTYGYSIFVAISMSLFIYAGSMQYVALSLLSSGASLLSAFIMTVVVNIRHLFYGISMFNKYHDLKKHKFYTIFSLTDETFSIVSSKKDKDDDYYFYLSLFNQLYWLIGTILGFLIGDRLPFSTSGIEFSMTALFICVVVDNLEKNKDYLPTIGGFIISLICLLIFGTSNFLVPSILFITLFLIILGKVRRAI